MFAAIHARTSSGNLAELAECFSPQVEHAGPDTVVFSIAGLRRLIGGLSEIASAISRRGSEMGIQANLAIAANPDTAILAARHLPGITLIPPGREVEYLECIRIDEVETDEELRDTLTRWGIRTLEELADLPPIGLAERLGEPADRLRRLTLGMIDRPLRLSREAEEYTSFVQLEQPLENSEQILFVVSPVVHDLTFRLKKNALATNRIEIDYQLDSPGISQRVMELPLATRSPQVLLKQIQVDLDAHPLGARLLKFRIRLGTAEPRALQGGLYIPEGPEPDRLQNVLARIEALVGKGNVGSPEILNTHRPDAYVVRPFKLSPSEGRDLPSHLPIKLALRICRPPLPARVKLSHARPAWISAKRVQGKIAVATGPWRTSGDWWAETAWNRDEWDVELSNGEVYRIYQDLMARNWFVQGMYD